MDAFNRAWYDAFSGCPPAAWNEYQAVFLAVYKAEAAYRKALRAQENSMTEPDKTLNS